MQLDRCSFKVKNAPSRSTLSMQVHYAATIVAHLVSETLCLFLGDIKSFFGVKTEKQEPRVSSPRILPTKSDKTDELLSSNTVSSSPVKKEEQSVDSDARLAKRCQQFPTNFVPASSLLDKSFEDEKEATQSEQPNQKRRRVSSPPRPKKTSTLKSPAKFKMSPGPKQSSLDFFFSKGSAPN